MVEVGRPPRAYVVPEGISNQKVRYLLSMHRPSMTQNKNTTDQTDRRLGFTGFYSRQVRAASKYFPPIHVIVAWHIAYGQGNLNQ